MSLIGQTVDSDQVRTCIKCGGEKPLSEFHKCPRHKLGVKGSCKACEKERQALSYQRRKEAVLERTGKYYEDNKDKYQVWNREWAQANPHKQNNKSAVRRSRLLNQSPELTPEEQQRIEDIYWLARDLRAVTGEPYEVDHIHPISKGGLHHPDNLQILPRDLNRRKSDKL